MSGYPRRRADLFRRDVEEELLLYDPRTGEVFLLNGTAAAIFELCDGSRSPQAIADEILTVLPADPDQVLADVHRILEEFTKGGLLEGSCGV